MDLILLKIWILSIFASEIAVFHTFFYPWLVCFGTRLDRQLLALCSRCFACLCWIAALVMVLCVYLLSPYCTEKATYLVKLFDLAYSDSHEGNWVPSYEIPCNDEVASLLSPSSTVWSVIQTKWETTWSKLKLKQQLLGPPPSAAGKSSFFKCVRI